MGSTAPAVGPATPLGVWLAPFAPQRSRAVQDWAQADTAIVAPDPAHAQFRLDPYTHLPRLAASLDTMRRTLLEPGKAIWIFDSRDHQGLDADEVRAVLDPWAAVEIVESAALAPGVERVVAAGRFRHEHLGLAFTFDERSLPRMAECLRQLAALAEANLPPAALFMRPAIARAITGLGLSRLARDLRRLARGGTAPGVIVSGKAHDFAVLPGSVRAVQRVWGTESPELVTRIRRVPEGHGGLMAMADALQQAGVTFDSSVPPHADGPFPAGIRAGAYYSHGAYFPQSFDLRTPAVQGAATGRFIELLPCDLSAEALGALWNRALQYDPVRLARLLDYFRIESYLRRPDDVGLAQRYHEFRVYNWGVEQSPARTVLVDGGRLPLAFDPSALVRGVEQLKGERGVRFHSDPVSFFAGARIEAKARLGATAPLAVQAGEHHYLERIPRDAPLRADVLWLLKPLPAGLASTLELGAGYGRLARELSGRAIRYVCLDLDPAMMRDLRADAREFGLVADIHTLPFANGSFDTVIANNVLEHAYDPVRALSEIGRVLADSGSLHALIPLDALNSRHRLPAHLWKADVANIRAAAAAAGLTIDAADVIHVFGLALPGSFPSCDGMICRLRARRGRAAG